MNSSKTVDDSNVAYTAVITISSVSGFLANFCLMLLILFTRSSITGEFRWFIFNQSFMDALFCLNTAAFLYTQTHPEFPDGFICIIIGFLIQYVQGGIIFALIPVTFNRKIAIFFPHLYSSFFASKVSIVFICLIFDLISAIPLLVGLQWGYFGKMPPLYYYCSFWPNEWPPPLGGGYRIIAQVAYDSVFVVYAYVIIVNVSVYIKLRRHVQQSASTVDMKETKEIVRATLIQAIMPIFLQSPGVLFSVAKWAFAVSVPKVVNNITYALFSFNSLLNVVIVFLVLKPFRRAFALVMKRILHGSDSQQTIVVSTATSDRHQGQRRTTNQRNVLH